VNSPKAVKKDSQFKAKPKNKLRQKDIISGEEYSSSPNRFINKNKWLMIIISMTIIPLLLLVGTELGLRWMGFGYRPTYFIKIKNSHVYLSNQKYGWRFFSPQLARQPLPFSIPLVKPQGTYRIFVLGGSAARGEPDYSFSFSRILGKMLFYHFPKGKFKIINTAMVAINSHVVYQIAKECAKLEPDLFIIYLGNNEVVGPFGPGTVFQSFSPNLTMIRLGLWAKSLRLGQLLNIPIQHLLGKTQTIKTWRGMEMFQQHRVPLTDPRLKTVYTHFAKNLTDIIATAQDSGAKVIVCTVATNLKDNPPFASRHRQDLTPAQESQWEENYNKGLAIEAEGEYREAINAYLQAAQIDDNYADLNFRLGRCYLRLNKHEEARQYYIKARDLDALRFRADSQINRIIRKKASGRENEGVYLVDAEHYFEINKRTDSKIPGEELFYDHVHMNYFGNYLLAKAVFSRLSSILPEGIRANPLKETSPLSPEKCALLLAFTKWDLYKILGRILDRISRPPFTNQIDHRQYQKKIIKQMKILKKYLTPSTLKLVAQVYKKSLENDQNDWILHNNFAELSRERGQYEEAISHWRRVLNYVPNFADVHNNLAALLVYRGNLNEAINHFLQALRINPYLIEAHINLGLVMKKAGKKKEAIKHFSEALRLRPDDKKIRGYLESCYDQKTKS